MDQRQQEVMDGSPAQVSIGLREYERRLRGEPEPRTGDPDACILLVHWQLGPIREVGVNGVQLEDVLQVCIDRLEGFQRGPFACDENHSTLHLLRQAVEIQTRRKAVRQAQGVEGLNQEHVS